MRRVDDAPAALRQPREAVANSWLSGQRVDGVVDLFVGARACTSSTKRSRALPAAVAGSRRGGEDAACSERATCDVPSWCRAQCERCRAVQRSRQQQC